MRSVSSDANPSFKRWLRLATQPRAVRELRATLAEGLHLAQAILANRHPIEALLVRRGATGVATIETINSVAATGVDAFELSPALFDRLSPVENSVGLLLAITVPDGGSTAGIHGDLLFLDGVQDPGNAGALLRVAAAAGVRNVLAAPTTAGLWAPRTLRAGQGAHFRLRLFEGISPATARAAFRGTWIAADPHDAQALWDIDLPSGALGWVFGAEGQGICADMRALCRHRVAIPLASGVESLNVAAAAAVCLFERRRRIEQDPALDGAQ